VRMVFCFPVHTLTISTLSSANTWCASPSM
jgi:hypothetical protein